MTDEQKKAIYQYIAAQLDIAVVDSPFIGALPQKAILFYYIDHQKELDIQQIVSDQKTEKVVELQKVIDDATMALDALNKATIQPQPLPPQPANSQL